MDSSPGGAGSAVVGVAAMRTMMWQRQWRGNDNGNDDDNWERWQHNGNAMGTTPMDGTMATAMGGASAKVIEGAMATAIGNKDNGNGRHQWKHNSDATVTAAMAMTATAMDGAMATQRQRQQ